VPSDWRPWGRILDDAPDWLVSLNTSIRQQISSRTGGMPDVVAWNDHDPLRSAIFIECKGRGEPFRETQEDWVWAACRAGVGITQIAVSVRPF
jgi:VRR-NUC domain